MTGVYVAVAALIFATVFGLIWRHRNGVLRARKDGDVERLDAADLGADLGDRATLVQFSSAFCAPCRGTRRVLGEVAEMVDGVAHVELDAEANLDLVRRLNVLRTPTVFVLDASGRIVRRASGLPRKVDIIAALGEAVA
ncbi:thioredoxin family protein [Actinoallomurus acanthiterrae]